MLCRPRQNASAFTWLNGLSSAAKSSPSCVSNFCLSAASNCITLPLSVFLHRDPGPSGRFDLGLLGTHRSDMRFLPVTLWREESLPASLDRVLDHLALLLGAVSAQEL